MVWQRRMSAVFRHKPMDAHLAVNARADSLLPPRWVKESSRSIESLGRASTSAIAESRRSSSSISAVCCSCCCWSSRDAPDESASGASVGLASGAFGWLAAETSGGLAAETPSGRNGPRVGDSAMTRKQQNKKNIIKTIYDRDKKKKGGKVAVKAGYQGTVDNKQPRPHAAARPKALNRETTTQDEPELQPNDRRETDARSTAVLGLSAVRASKRTHRGLFAVFSESRGRSGIGSRQREFQ